jgi:hypothetical protein
MGQSKLERHAQEIVPGLWLGERWACRYAHEAGFRTICVLETPSCGVEDCFHAPILIFDRSVIRNDRQTELSTDECSDLIRCDTHRLKRAHHAIDEFLQACPVLVHCLAGRERSPLVVATWLCERRGFVLGEAYKLIMGKRPIVENRECWLGNTERDRYGSAKDPDAWSQKVD